MRDLWLAIIVASGAPLVYPMLLANPLVLLLLGVDGWLERVHRLAPHRWRLLLLIVVCAFASAVYAVRYG